MIPVIKIPKWYLGPKTVIEEFDQAESVVSDIERLYLNVGGVAMSRTWPDYTAKAIYSSDRCLLDQTVVRTGLGCIRGI